MRAFRLGALLGAVACCNGRPQKGRKGATRYIFITGDSYTTTGFNITMRPRPSHRHPLGNPSYPGATLSGADNWVDVVVFNSTTNATQSNFTVAYNLAVGSNTVNISETQLAPADAPHPVSDMIDQVNELETLFLNQSRFPLPHWKSTNSLFINWFGINDIFYNGLFTNRSFTEAEPYLQSDIEDYFTQCERLYSLGARQFLTVLVPPIYRTPVINAGSKIDQARNMTQFWNDHIQKLNENFTAQHPDATSDVFDPTPVFDHILDNFEDYGAPNNTCFSYPQGQPCLWHDFIHPGIVIQEHLGTAIREAIDETGFFP